MSKVLISILTALILVVSCKRQCHYPYLDGLKSYLHEVHQYDLPPKGDFIFYITPLDGCDYCVRHNLLVLSRSANKRLIPVLIDKNYNPDYMAMVKKIKSRYPLVLEDPSAAIQHFQTGYLEPVLVHVKNGRCLFYMEIKDSDIPTAEKYLKTTE